MFGSNMRQAMRMVHGNRIGDRSVIPHTAQEKLPKPLSETKPLKFIGSGEDVFLDDKGDYKLPECQC